MRRRGRLRRKKIKSKKMKKKTMPKNMQMSVPMLVFPLFILPTLPGVFSLTSEKTGSFSYREGFLEEVETSSGRRVEALLVFLAIQLGKAG